MWQFGEKSTLTSLVSVNTTLASIEEREIFTQLNGNTRNENGQPIQQSKLTLIGPTRSAAISRDRKWNNMTDRWILGRLKSTVK